MYGNGYSAILGGRNNINNHTDSFIIGSDITSQANCVAHVNNIVIMNVPVCTGSKTIVLPVGHVWRCTTDNILRIKT